MIEYKGYTGIFEFDPEIDTFTGHVVDLRDQIHFEGDLKQELRESMERALDHCLQVCRKRWEEPDRPFSGRFNVRFGPDLHRKVVKAPAASRESMNEWLAEAAERRLAE